MLCEATHSILMVKAFVKVELTKPDDMSEATIILYTEALVQNLVSQNLKNLVTLLLR